MVAGKNSAFDRRGATEVGARWSQKSKVQCQEVWTLQVYTTRAASPLFSMGGRNAISARTVSGFVLRGTDLWAVKQPGWQTSWVDQGWGEPGPRLAAVEGKNLSPPPPSHLLHKRRERVRLQSEANRRCVHDGPGDV
eukprot:353935-Chlamydomonas_euryale.AAC.2